MRPMRSCSSRPAATRRPGWPRRWKAPRSRGGCRPSACGRGLGWGCGGGAAPGGRGRNARRAPPRREGDMMPAAVKLAPSILAAAFARLGDQVREAEQAGADRIHVDVMDGHFVPNLSMGAPIVQCLRPVTRLPLETHLMISNPDLFLDEFTEAGSDSFLVHWEGNNNLSRTVQH